MNYRKVEIETIPTLNFTKSDVLASADEQRERRHQLVSATALTVLDHEEVGLVIRLDDGEHVEIFSTLIEYEDNFVELKGGFIIPLHAIVRVEI